MTNGAEFVSWSSGCVSVSRDTLRRTIPRNYQGPLSVFRAHCDTLRGQK